jgi:polyphosphate glucokinase
MKILGIDIGGTGIKAAPVDLTTGALTAERYRLPTPEGAKPKAVAEVVGKLAQHFAWQGPIGCGFPAIIRSGVALSAANVHSKWINTDAAALFAAATGCPVHVLNDADAAGLAEMEFGAGKDQPGVVLMITIGTGLGSALFVDGRLVPNTELGHMELQGQDAELLASDAARQRMKISWAKWAGNFNLFLNRLDLLFSPDLFILGGGAVKKQEKWLPLLKLSTPVAIARAGNDAGIIGAALSARGEITNLSGL